MNTFCVLLAVDTRHNERIAWRQPSPVTDRLRRYVLPRPNTAKAVLTDVQFWIPVAVLVFGLALLVWLH
jgi:hypothetical protein